MADLTSWNFGSAAGHFIGSGRFFVAEILEASKPIPTLALPLKGRVLENQLLRSESGSAADVAGVAVAVYGEGGFAVMAGAA
jgi:hypothetical protein